MVVVRHIATWCIMIMVPQRTWLIVVASTCLELLGYAWLWPVDACRLNVFKTAIDWFEATFGASTS
jgi:hypothetical protein